MRFVYGFLACSTKKGLSTSEKVFAEHRWSRSRLRGRDFLHRRAHSIEGSRVTAGNRN